MNTNMGNKLTIIISMISFMTTNIYSQVIFKTIRGYKADYSISIPEKYFPRQAIGANIDIKYANSEGASIITVVKNLPAGIDEGDIKQMNSPTDQEFVDVLESSGMQNVSVIKRGFMVINGVNSYFAYYREAELYHHTVTQYRKGKSIHLSYTFDYSKKGSYMPYVFRVINSLKT